MLRGDFRLDSATLFLQAAPRGTRCPDEPARAYYLATVATGHFCEMGPATGSSKKGRFGHPRVWVTGLEALLSWKMGRGGREAQSHPGGNDRGYSRRLGSGCDL